MADAFFEAYAFCLAGTPNGFLLGFRISTWYISLQVFAYFFNLCRLDGKPESVLVEIKFGYCNEASGLVSFDFSAS